MQTLSFDYVDTKGKESHRNLAVISGIGDTAFGIDFTELSDEEAGEFTMQLSELLRKQAEEIDRLAINFDLKHKLRQFKFKQMTNLEKEVI